MISYVKAVHTLLAHWFNLWEVSMVLVPIVIALLTGYFVANSIAFRDQHSRLMLTFGDLARTLALGIPEEGRITREMWADGVSKVFADYWRTATAMSGAGFDSVAVQIHRISVELTNELNAFTKPVDDVVPYMAMGTTGVEQYQRDLRRELNKRLVDFFHVEISANNPRTWSTYFDRFARLKPTTLELVGAPNFSTFRKFSALVRRAVRHAQLFGHWIDANCAPVTGVCYTCLERERKRGVI